MPSQLYHVALDRQSLAVATHYVGLQFGGRDQGALHISWFDATSNAAITLQGSLYDAKSGAKSSADDNATVDAVETDAGNEHLWVAHPSVTITGPAATAPGAEIHMLNDLAGFRWRLKIVVSATADMEILARPCQDYH